MPLHTTAFKRSVRMTALSLAVATLYACGGGGDDGAAPTPAPEAAPSPAKYSAVYFYDDKSRVAMVDNLGDGTGTVAYRNTDNTLQSVDVVDESGMIYRLGMDQKRIVSIQFDDYILYGTDYDADGQMLAYSFMNRDGDQIDVSMNESPSMKSARAISDVTQKLCLQNHSDELLRQMDEYRCKLPWIAIEAQPVFKVANYLVQVVQTKTETGLEFVRKRHEGLRQFINTTLMKLQQKTMDRTIEQIATVSQVLEPLDGDEEAERLAPEQVKQLITDITAPAEMAQILNVSNFKPSTGSEAPVVMPPPPEPLPPAAGSAYEGSYTIAGGGVTVDFNVKADHTIQQCQSEVMVVCTGQVVDGGGFMLSGSDNDGTEVSISGTIGSGGQVQGSFTGNSDGASIGGSIAGSRTSSPAPVTPPVGGEDKNDNACVSISRTKYGNFKFTNECSKSININFCVIESKNDTWYQCTQPSGRSKSYAKASTTLGAGKSESVLDSKKSEAVSFVACYKTPYKSPVLKGLANEGDCQ